MKTMTCRQLGGGCDLEFKGEDFDTIAMQSKSHGAEMISRKDRDHLEAMQNLQNQLKSPKDWSDWYEGKRKEFNEILDIGL
jgi:hypothetical protein